MDRPVSLILGVGQTVGEAIALRFIEAGHNILAVDPDETQLAAIKKVAGDKIETHHGDIHTKIGLKNALSLCLENHGRLDNVICIPALPGPDELLANDAVSDTESDRAMKCALNTLRILGTYMRDLVTDPETAGERTRQAGTFTFVLSVSAISSQPGWFSEGVSQKAIRGMVQSASVELAPHHIRVNAISALRPRAEGREPWLAERTPSGRASIGEEIAETALFLCNPRSNIITGETITLDGGRQNLTGLIAND